MVQQRGGRSASTISPATCRKAALPAITSLLLLVMPWRHALLLLAGAGLLVAAAVFFLMPPVGKAVTTKTVATQRTAGGRGGFVWLLSIGILDTAVRMGLLTFLPFLLHAKGASLPMSGLALTLVFVGGAAGKFVCGWLGARVGTLPHRAADRRRHGGVHPRRASAAAAARGRAAAAARRDAERHIPRCCTEQCRSLRLRIGRNAPSRCSTPAPSDRARCLPCSTACSATPSAPPSPPRQPPPPHSPSFPLALALARHLAPENAAGV